VLHVHSGETTEVPLDVVRDQDRVGLLGSRDVWDVAQGRDRRVLAAAPTARLGD
jgi:hypothetical protein